MNIDVSNIRNDRSFLSPLSLSVAALIFENVNADLPGARRFIAATGPNGSIVKLYGQMDRHFGCSWRCWRHSKV